jgi:acyl carrier protein
VNQEEIRQGVQSIFETVFRRPDIVITPALTAADVPGWDSFRYVSIIMATEERFGIQFSDADIDGLKNVGDLLGIIAAKTQAGPA